MAVMKMVALTVIGPQSEMEPVARRMVLTGGFQPLSLEKLINDRSLQSRLTTETENPYDALVGQISAVWKVAGEETPPPQPVAIGKDFTLTKARMLVEQTSKKLQIWEKRRAALAGEEELLQKAGLLARALKAANFSPKDIAGSEFVKTFFGSLTSENFERLKESAKEFPLVLNSLASSGGDTWAVVFTLPDRAEPAKKLLDAVYFKEFPLSEFVALTEGGDPVAMLDRLAANRKRAIDGLAKAAKEMLSGSREKYELLFSELYTMQRIYEVCKGRGEVSGMFLLSGWVPEETYSAISEKIAAEAPNTTLAVEDTREISSLGVSIPVMLRNNALFRAFQDIVAIYSLPSYGEMDPSPFVALTFVIFFGFMFGDIGHGLIVFLGSLLLVKRGILRRSLGRVMCMGALSSVVFGFLYGSIFGMEDVLPALWLSPMHDINRLIGMSICVGVSIISFGIALNIVKQYKARDFGRLLFDGQGMAGLLLYWTLCVLAMIYITGLEVPGRIVNFLLCEALVMLLLMAFRIALAKHLLRQKDEGESSVMNVFEIVHGLLSFLSNTTSFVRLAAFALNHVGLSFAVIMLSDMVRALPGGIVMKAVVFVIGNIVISGLEGLIVFIQTLRLEYYEFFSKFYRGGGSAFKPVRWSADRGEYSKAGAE